MARLADHERPRDVAGVRRLIRRRRSQIRVIEAALQVKHPADVRRIMVRRLEGTKANLASWETHLAKNAGGKR